MASLAPSVPEIAVPAAPEEADIVVFAPQLSSVESVVSLGCPEKLRFDSVFVELGSG
jgi:hypothetical protein